MISDCRIYIIHILVYCINFWPKIYVFANPSPIMIRLDHFVQTDLALSMCDADASGGGGTLAVCHLGEWERQNANRGGTRTYGSKKGIHIHVSGAQQKSVHTSSHFRSSRTYPRLSRAH